MIPVLIDPPLAGDLRGSFCKIWHPDILSRHGIRMEIAEEFFTRSRRGVIRGMHFQLPPRQHSKLVTCLTGEVLDVVVDLRVGSPDYGRPQSFRLSAASAQMLYVPEGFAHGFLSLSEESLLLYRCSSVHSPAHDAGIRWDSLGFAWPCAAPILSERDKAHPGLAEFDSPFRA
jgi:dTDP-4-dehydrorhamnose 3,5-epimerase